MSYHDIEVTRQYVGWCERCDFTVTGRSEGSVEVAAKEHLDYSDGSGTLPNYDHAVLITHRDVVSRS